MDIEGSGRVNLISFSLYGTDPKYLSGIVRNSEMVRDLLPDWQMRTYCSLDVPKETIFALLENGCQVSMQEDHWHPNGMFWRYLPIGEDGVSKIAFRDADSRIFGRDVIALEEWVDSKLPVHIIRDHPYHQTPILGGLWGIDNQRIKLLDFWTLAAEFSVEFGEDQRFLSRHVYPLVHGHTFIHDGYFAFEPKPSRNFLGFDKQGYLGESFSANDTADIELRAISEKYYSSVLVRIRLLVSSFFQAKLNLCKSKFISQRSLSIPK